MPFANDRPRRPGRPLLAACAMLALSLTFAVLSTGCQQTTLDCESKPLLSIGDAVTKLSVTDAAGELRRIDELIDGKVALIDIWATWCPPCLEALPHLTDLHDQFADRGFTVVGLLVDENAEEIGPRFVEKRDLTYPVYYDDGGDTVTCAWGEFFAVPTIFIVDANGEVVEVYEGVGDPRAIDKKIEEMFGEAVASTTAL